MSGSEGVPSRYFEEKPVCRNRILNDKNRVLATIRFSRYYAWHLVTSFGTQPLGSLIPSGSSNET
jgi:hypothetical protein